MHAAALNPYDWHVLRGDPYIAQAHRRRGDDQAEVTVAGIDAAARVEAIGANVQGLRPGDEVFGLCPGAFAEYMRADANKVVPKPASLGFEQAAAIPTEPMSR